MPVTPATTETSTEIPAMIDVMGVRFLLALVAGKMFAAEGPDGSLMDVTGHIDYDQQLISLSKGAPAYTHRVVLVHELVHAILRVTGHAEVEEEAVRALGYGLVYLLRHNPNLVKFLTAEEA